MENSGDVVEELKHIYALASEADKSTVEMDADYLAPVVKEAYSEIEYLRCRVARLEGLA